MSHQERYNLTWDNYSDHMRKLMKKMMVSGAFSDVTIVSDDQKLIMAHRNILSASSEVLKNILMMEGQNNSPVIYLRGIQFTDIQSILEFIYLGEAMVSEERIHEYLLIAKSLEIKELSRSLDNQKPDAVLWKI